MFSWDASRDVEGWVQAVIDHRRALDLLESLPEIDAGRIGYVGYSLGGFLGGILAGLDGRVDGYVLTGAGGYFTDAVEHVDFGSGPPPYGDALTSYQDALAAVNPVNYVGDNEGAAFLFQGSESDEYMSVENFRAYLEAAPEPKALEWYSGGHDLKCPFIFGEGSTSCDAGTDWLVFHRAWLQENV
jgi:dienelactone hydrolase